MIPKFPEFKKLELSDQSDIEKITSKYQPYSDFNFQSLWSWNVFDTSQVSILNENLVVIYKDHITQETELTYLGSSNVNDTLDKLFNFMEKSSINFKNCKFPEISISKIDFKKFFIEIDLDFCEYIYDINKLSSYERSEYIKKRGKVNTFVKNNKQAGVKKLNLNSDEIGKDLLLLNDKWIDNRSKKVHDDKAKNEPIALKRFLDAKFKNSIGVGVYNNNELIGFSLATTEANKYAISHFTKADTSYVGVYEFLMRESARVLEELGCHYLNYQEDLGLDGLRVAKHSYRPIGFLRKYKISKH